MAKTVVVGDIHGCYHTLMRLLDNIGIDEKSDKIVFLGDYIDRGLYSKEVVEHLRAMQSRMGTENCVCLMGNHEHMALSSCSGEDVWMSNGGCATLWSYRYDIEQLADDVQWFNGLPVVAKDKHHIYSHAGLSYPLLEDCNASDLLWDRSWLRAKELLPREQPVVFGHTPFRDITYLPNGDIGIDCGCYSGGMLCAVAFDEEGLITEYRVKRDDRDADPTKIREMLIWLNDSKN